MYLYKKQRPANSIISLSSTDILHLSKGFDNHAQTPATGLEALYNTITHTLAHIDLPPEHQTRINAFTNALHNIFETVKEADQQSKFFQIEKSDLNMMTDNLDCFGLVIRIQHHDLQHHDASANLLRAKTALRNLANKMTATA